MTDASHLPAPDRLRGTRPPGARRALFGSLVVDLGTGEVRRNGSRLKVQEQPFRVLVLLLERAGEVVTREELRARLWPNEFVDFDHSLNTAVRKLREALDDSAEHPRFIETLSRRGYRFIAPVSWEGDSRLVEPARPSRQRRPLLLAGVAVAILLIAAAVAYVVNRRPDAAPANAIDAVAVLPFTNEDPQSQHLSDGMTEILIDNLSRLPDLRVMARTTVFDYKGKKIDPREAGRALNVSGVVVGHLRRDGDRYEIHVELVDAKDGTQVWGDRFSATAATLSTAQVRISEELTSQLRQGINRERRLAARRYSRDPQAYEAYLWGLYALNKRDLPRAAEYFNRAIARDPEFAAAHAGIASTYGVMVGYGLLTAADGVPRVLAAADRALQLDPNNAQALVSIATTKYRNLWDFPGAEADYRRALALNPSYATGHEWYADYLRSMGRWAEAGRELEVAHKLDPLSSPINAMMCYHLYYERRYREAVATANRPEAADSGHIACGCIAASLTALGEIERSLPFLREAKVPESDTKQMEEAFRLSGRSAYFRKAAELLTQRQSQNVETPVEIAELYAWSGDSAQAFAWLEQAYQKRVGRLTNINIEPAFDSLHSDPRFDDLLKRIGLPRVEPPRS